MKKIIILSTFLTWTSLSIGQIGYNYNGDFISLYKDTTANLYYSQEAYNMDDGKSLPYQERNEIVIGSILKKDDDGKKTESINEYVSDIYYSSFNKNRIAILPRIIISSKAKAIIDEILEIYKSLIYLDEIDDNIFKLNCSVKNSDEVLGLVAKICKMDGIEWCEPSFLSTLQKDNTYYSQQFYLNNYGQSGGVSGIDINVEPAWNITCGSSDIVVAVIDDGIDRNHEDFDNRILYGYTVNNSIGMGMPQNMNSNDRKAHGTACAGIIGASNNSIGIRGIASNSNILPVNICPKYEIIDGSSFASYEEIANAIKWAYQRADVLSCSWHLGNLSNYINDAINKALTLGREGKGSVVVFAAGNDGSTTSVNYPAILDDVIAVGAVQNNGVICDFSNQGNGLDLVAVSGTNNIVTTDLMGTNGVNNGNYNFSFGGTSAACPQVSGIVALMLSVNPSLTVQEVRNILYETARDMGSPGYDSIFGYGLVDAFSAVCASIVRRMNGSSTICNTVTYSIDSLVNDMSVEWELDDTHYANNPSLFKINHPTIGKCTIKKDNNFALNATLSAKVFYNGSLYKTFEKDVRTINAVPVSCYRWVEGCSGPVPIPCDIPSGTIERVPVDCIVNLQASEFSDMTITHTDGVTSFFDHNGNLIRFTIPSENFGDVLRVTGQGIHSCQQFSYTFYTNQRPHGPINPPGPILPRDSLIFFVGNSPNGNENSIGGISNGLLPISLLYVVKGDTENKETRKTSDEGSFEFVALKDDEEWILEIYQASTNQKVRSLCIKGSTYSLDTSSLASGVYVFRAILDEQRRSVKIKL